MPTTRASGMGTSLSSAARACPWLDSGWVTGTARSSPKKTHSLDQSILVAGKESACAAAARSRRASSSSTAMPARPPVTTTRGSPSPWAPEPSAWMVAMVSMAASATVRASSSWSLNTRRVGLVTSLSCSFYVWSRSVSGGAALI